MVEILWYEPQMVVLAWWAAAEVRESWYENVHVEYVHVCVPYSLEITPPSIISPLTFWKKLLWRYIYLQLKPSLTYESGSEAYIPVCGERLLVDSSVFGFSIDNEGYTPELLWYIWSLKVAAPSVGSIVSLFTGIEKKTWRISHFRNRDNRQPSWLLAFTVPMWPQTRYQSHC